MFGFIHVPTSGKLFIVFLVVASWWSDSSGLLLFLLPASFAWLMLPVVCHIQVNNKATLLFSSLINDEVHENILLPDLPYVTDEHGSKSSPVVVIVCIFVVGLVILILTVNVLLSSRYILSSEQW